MRRSPKPERVLATVLFTDIVGSTELASKLGDRSWRDLVARHHAAVRRELKRFRGREIDTAGDGFFALFDRPASAVECAVAVIEAVRPLGIEIRAGVHTGEVEVAGKSAGGIAVHIGARVVGRAEPGEVLVTATVRDLVAGSGLELRDRGTAALKGVDGEWHLYGLRPAPAGATTAATGSRADANGDATRSRPWPLIAIAGLGAVAIVALGALVLPLVLAGPVRPAAGTVARIPPGQQAFDLAARVGQQPTGAAVGDGAIWVINFADGTLSRVDPATGLTTANPAVTGRPGAVAYGSDAVWVTAHLGRPDGAAGAVVRFDERGVLDEEIEVGNGVDAIAADGGSIWIADRLRDEVRRIDPATNRLAGDPIPVGRAPGALAVGGGDLWVTSTLDSTLWRIDLATSESRRISLPGPPSAIALDDDSVWVTSEVGDSLTRVEISTGTPAIIPGLDGARGVAVNGDGVWVAVGGQGRVVRIDREAHTVVDEVAVDGVADAVAVDGTGAVWVTVRAP